MSVKADPATNIEVLFSPEAIASRIDELCAAVAATGFENLLVVPIMTGSFMFSADLLRGLYRAGMSPEVDFLSLASYRLNTSSSGSVDILRDLELDVQGRDVLIVDDILDTGRTLTYAQDLIVARGAKRTQTCVLLNKKVRRQVPVEADHVAFECPPVFVVGYGMDLANRYRELPFVGRIATAS
ncbi:MAG: hypoxanthine phosphoribosyltransferase [Hyphomicrobiaceae bacterium]